MGGGKSGQGGGTSYQSSSVQIPPEVMARYNAVNTRAEAVANTPWAPYTGEFVAPVNQTQQGGINTITGAAGVDTPYFNQATNAIDQGLSQAGPLYQTGANQVAGGLAAGNWLTGQGIGTATASAGAAAPYNGLAAGQLNTAYGNTQPLNNAAIGLAAGATGAVNPGDLNIGQYMSPYNEGVVQSTLGLLKQDQKMQQNDLRDSQIMEGSFGGDRSGVGKANLQRQQDLAYGNVAAQLYNQNYGQALGAAQQQQGVGLAAGQANRAALASGAQNIAGIGQQQFAQGQAAAQGNLGIGQQIYGQGQGLATAQMQGGNQIYNMGAGAAGTNAGLASGIYNMGAGAAGTYGQLGTQQLTNQLTQGQAQIGAGTVQQQTQQAEDTAKYQQFMQERGYPFQVAQFLANIAMGTGAQSGSTTNTVATQPQPYFSDERLKENVHVIGKTHDGQPIIRFNYKGDPSTQIGLSAQETEKHHPEAVGLSSGFKTVDYDAATRDSIAKAGGGGLGTDMAGILEQQRAMFPGAHDPRGIASGVGPHGIAIAPLKASAPQASKVDMRRPETQSGAKKDIDSALGLYNTGKGLASAYSEGKDTLVGTAGKKAADGTMTNGTSGWFGSGGKWNPGEGSASKIFSNDNTGLASGKITTENLAPPTSLEPGNAADVNGVVNVAAPSTADAGLATGMEWGSMFANRGGRMQRAAGGGMPYSDTGGYIPEDLYKPVDPDKPDEGDKAKMAAPGGGGQQKDGTGKAIGSLAGMGIGAMFGMPGVGSMLGGMAGGMFKDGGRTGLATGGVDEFSPIPNEEEPDPLRRLRAPEHTPMPRRSPVSEAGLAAGAGFPVDVPELPPKDEGHRTAPFEFSQDRLPSMDRYAARMPGTPGGLGTPGSTGTADFPPPVNHPGAGPGATSVADFPPRPPGTAFPESGTVPPAEGLASGQSVTAGAPSGPTLPDGTPITDGPAAAPAAPPAAGLATSPATGAPAMAPSSRIALPPGFTAPGGQHPADAPYDPSAYTQFVFGRESNGRDFNNPNWPTKAGGPDGPGQFIPGTWQAFVQARPDLFAGKSPAEIDALRKDPALSAQATQWYADKNSGPLKAAGVPLTNGNLYMAHMLDGGPAASLLSNPNMDAVEALKKAGVSDAQARASITQNGGTVGMTAGQFAELHKYKRPTGGAPSQVSSFRPEGQTPAAGLAAGQPQAPAAQETPDFIDRAGNWIDRNQRPIMAGLAFIGNMLGSKSHQLTGAIGDGLAAAAPMYMATGFKETELKQGQERIDIGARAQYMAVLARQQQMQNDFIRANGARSPELDTQMQRTIELINGKGGVAAIPGGSPQTTDLRGAPPSPTPARTDLAPGAPSATPAPAPSSPPAAPAPGAYTGGPPPLTADFLRQLDPKHNPNLLQAAADRQRANGDREGADQLEQQAITARNQINATGQGKGPGGVPVKLPHWDTYQAQQRNLVPNQEWLQKAETATQNRVAARQNINQIKDLIENFESGTGTDIKAQVAGVADALGIARPKTDTMDQAAFKSFVKDAYLAIIEKGAAGPNTDAMRGMVEQSFAGPTLPPEANKKILSQFLGNLNYEDAYASHITKAITESQLVDQKIVGDAWRAQDKEKNNPDYHQREAYKSIAALGATPENIRDIKDGHHYMLKPEEYFRLQGPNGAYSLDQIRKAYADAGKRAIKYVAKRNEAGGIDWKMVTK